MTAKQLVLSRFPKAKCTKDIVTREVVITLGETAHDHWMHQDRDTFKFSYGTADECWRTVAMKLKLTEVPRNG